MIIRPALFAFAAGLGLAAPAAAETLVTTVSTPRVAIRSNFAGVDIVVFGGIIRESGLATHGRYDIVITVRGPSGPIDVREKARRALIWINTERKRFADAPSYLAIASSRPVEKVADAQTIADYRLSLDMAMDPEGARAARPAERPFRDALLRLKGNEGLYLTKSDGVVFLSDDLFRATIPLPANVPLGIYQVETRLLIDGEVATGQRASLEVIKAGFENNVALWSQQRSAVYGLATVAIALSLGWVATVIFRRD